jgi:hypothetical protein
MDPVSLTGLAISVVDVATKILDYISSVKSAKDDIRRLSQELFALKGTLDQIVLFKGNPSNNEALATQMDGMIAMTRETLDSIQKRLARPKTVLGKAAHTLKWPFKKSDVDQYVSALERAKTWFIMVLMQDNTETTSAVYSEMQRLAKEFHEEVLSRQLDRMLGETEHILAWLSPVNFEDDLVKADRPRVHGTGQWFLDKSFEAWADGSSNQPFMWITGKCEISLSDGKQNRV